MRNQTTTNVPAAAIAQKAIGTCSRLLQTPNTAVNTGRIAETVAAWLAGRLCSAIVVKIGKTNTIPTAARHNRRTCLPAGSGYFPSRAQTNAIVPAPAPLANAINQGSNPRKARHTHKRQTETKHAQKLKIHPSSSAFVRFNRTSEDKPSSSLPDNPKMRTHPFHAAESAQTTQPEQIQNIEYKTRTV